MDFAEIFKEMLAISIAKRKIESGVELTQEEKEKVLQSIYSGARKEINDGKDLNGTKARLAFRTLSIMTRLMGEKGKGANAATKAVLVSTKNNIDNYRRVLRGVSITAENQVIENFQTLIAQYEASEKYGEIMTEFIQAYLEANNSYKKDYQSPIATDLVSDMEDKREEVLELDSQYIKK